MSGDTSEPRPGIPLAVRPDGSIVLSGAGRDQPPDIGPCPTCGHIPDMGERLKWLAGCPDDHRVIQGQGFQDNIVGHIWPDHTISVVALAYDLCNEDTALRWLEAVHAGRFPRRPRAEASVIQPDAWVEEPKPE